MNERIRELWNKAKANLDEDFSSGRKSISIPKSYDEMVQEKFAELIVRECVAISNQAEQQCQHPATMIKQHFGVER